MQSRGDGRVEVALQQRLDDGEWGARILPPSRFLPADAERDRWHYSTPVALEITDLATGDRACFVTHGAPSDVYWRTLHDAAEAKAAELGLLREILGAVADGRILFSVYDQTIGALEYMLVIVRNLRFSAELFPGSPVFLFPPRLFAMQDAQAILAQIEAQEAAATESDG